MPYAVGTIVRFALGLTLLLRVVYSAWGFFLAPYLKLSPEVVNANRLTGVMAPSDSLAYRLLGVWQRFDTVWYAGIARAGYQDSAAWVFYPLYPMLGCVGDPYLLLLVAATVAAFFAFWGLFELVRLDSGGRAARRAVILLAVWPGAFTLFAGYAESLTLACVLWSVLFARRDRWLAAGALGAAAGLAKAGGAAVVILLAVLAWKRRDARAWLAVALAVAGAAAFPLYQRSQGVDVTRIYAAHWGTATTPPWTTLADAVRSIAGGNVIAAWNLAMLLLVAGVAVWRGRLEYRLFAAALALLFLAKNTYEPLQSMSRYVLLIFPFFAAAAQRRWSFNGFAVTCAALFLWNLLFARAFFEWLLIV